MSHPINEERAAQPRTALPNQHQATSVSSAPAEGKFDWDDLQDLHHESLKGLDRGESIQGDYVVSDGRPYPIVDCTLQMPITLTFECPYCRPIGRGGRLGRLGRGKRRHYHGTGGEEISLGLQVGDLAGHRGIHCDPETAPEIWRRGIFLRVVEIIPKKWRLMVERRASATAAAGAS